jgi:hypothetical protein
MKQIYLAVLGLCAAAPVLAQTGMQLPALPPLDNVRLTREQLQTLMPPLAAHFDEIDSVHQGYVTGQQIQQYVSKHPPQPTSPSGQLPPPPQFTQPPQLPEQGQQSVPSAPAYVDPNTRLTKAQLHAAMSPMAAHFDEIDTDHRGYVTAQQIQQYVSTHPPRFP